MGENAAKGDNTMTKCSIADIAVSERIREDMGNIRELAESMQRYGLIHPVVLDANRNLVAGGRRLEAARNLGWTEVEVRFLGELSDRERRYIELEENVRRKDLTEYERSQRLMELMEAVKEVAEEEAIGFAAQEIEAEFKFYKEVNGETCAEPAQVVPETGKRGPTLTPGSYRDVSQRTGIPVKTLQEAKQHVEAVQEIPALESQPKTAVIQAGRELKKIAEPEQRKEYKEALNEHPNVVQFAQKPQDVMNAVEQRRKDTLQKNFDAIDEAYDTKTRMDKGMGLILRQKTKYNPERIPEVLQNYISCCPQRSDLEMAYENAEAVLQLLIPFRDRLKKLLTKPEVVK